MITQEQLKNLNKMIDAENELALLMCYIRDNSSNHHRGVHFKMIGNSESLFSKYCHHLQDSFAQETLNNVMLQRVALQKEISKFVTMDFRDEQVNLKTVGN